MGKCTCDVFAKMTELENEDRLTLFLVNLNSDYDAMKSQIMAQDPAPIVIKAYYTLLYAEKQRQISSSVPDAVAFFTIGHNQYNRGFKIESQGNNSEKREQRKTRGNEKKLCLHCKLNGHSVEECFEIVGYPDWYHGKRKHNGAPKLASHVTSEENQQGTPLDEGGSSHHGWFDPKFMQAMCQEMMRMFKGKTVATSVANFAGSSFVNLVSQEFNKFEWILDTRATIHMTPHLCCLTNVRKLVHPVLVKLPDGLVKKVTRSRNVEIQPGFVITDVLYVPDFKFNLLYVSKIIVQKGVMACFDDSCYELQDRMNRRMVALGKESGGLYRMHAKGKKMQKHFEACHVLVAGADIQTFHDRLGHISYSKMKHLPEYGVFESSDNYCDTCSLVKFHRLPFALSDSKSDNCFDLLHMDL